MTCETITKAPADVLDYDFDFARWMPEGDYLSAASAVITGVDATVTKIDRSDTLARVWIAGGTAGDTGTLTLTATTHLGRTKEVSVQLKIKGASSGC